jgi:hypothetical protein
LPSDIVVTARTVDDYVVMGIRHLNAPAEGVQFHPESVLTPHGPHLLANFLRLCGEGDGILLDQATGSFALVGFVQDIDSNVVTAAAAAAGAGAGSMAQPGIPAAAHAVPANAEVATPAGAVPATPGQSPVAVPGRVEALR